MLKIPYLDMDAGQLKGTPREVYGGIVNLVEGIFKDDSLILTGSAVGILNGSSNDVNTNRMAYLEGPQGVQNYIRPSSKDINLMIVSHTGLDRRPDYFAEKAIAMEDELNEDQKKLLNISIADPYILAVLGELSTLAEEFEKAHSEGNLRELTEIRNIRSIIINGILNQIGYLYTPLSTQPFVHGPDLPYFHYLHRHTSSLATGRDYAVFGNQDLSDRVIEASKVAYIPEELGELNFSGDAYKKLKESGITTISQEIYEVFNFLARHEGFRRAEIKQSRKVKGLWDPTFGEHNIQEIKDKFQSEYPKLLDMIYD